ncbi:MAG: HDOD domain-containing protein [Chloroflexi bacterium]|nr:HDOD domain-containing protein [Chloroflexota bacterium]
MKKRILFVDDDPSVLQSLQRLFHHMRHEWEMVFVSNGAEALALMAQSPFDVAVSDLRMPLMTGQQFLAEVRKRSPKTARIIHSEFADKYFILQCLNSAHQFLGKPCDPELLMNIVRRTLSLEQWLTNERLQTLTSQMAILPALPETYLKVMDHLQSSDICIETIGDIIARDVGMTAKVLQVANSAFFGLQAQIANPTEAVLLLGLETVKALVLWVHIFSQYHSQRLSDFSIQNLSAHSLAAGMLAREIVRGEDVDQRMADDALAAGLLHDVGKLVLAVNLGEEYRSVRSLARERSQPVWQAELDRFGVTHAEIGAYLLGLWGLPCAILEAVAFHHQPSASAGGHFSALTAVHVANVLRQSAGLSDDIPAQVDYAHIAALALCERWAVWQKLTQRQTADDNRPPPRERNVLCQ